MFSDLMVWWISIFWVIRGSGEVSLDEVVIAILLLKIRMGVVLAF
jgi:hypothetical protein